jgi:hypothetical protein
MILSEAIRLGAMLRPQGFGRYIDRSEKVFRSCAFAAAVEAVVNKARFTESVIETTITNNWSWVYGKCLACPVRGCDADSRPSCMITHLNDTHRWTRERIADWVETVEPKTPIVESAEESVSVEASITVTTETL